MPFELIMLLGFLGTVLLTLLPATPAKTGETGFRRWHGRRRSDGESANDRCSRTMRGKKAIRPRRAGRAAA